jgi:ATP-dependent DNA helicase RecG
MSTEGQTLDQKSLRYALGKHEDADGLACDCVGFANAAGGTILLGIEDGQDEPPAGQRVADDFPDRVRKQIARTAIVDLTGKADQTLQLSQKELITLGLLAQHEALTAIELVKTLELSRAEDLKLWVGRLKDLGVVNSRGKTKATEYFVEPQVLRTLEFQGETTLEGIERHRLRELIQRELEIYRKASIGEIHGRIGKEIPRRKIRRELTDLVKAGGIGKDGNTRAAIYLWTK